MDRSKLRRQIAWEAARLMYDRRESEYFRAKMKAVQKQKRSLPDAWAEIESAATELGTAINCMQLLTRQGVVWLPTKLRADVYKAQRSIELAIQPRATWQDREYHLWSVADSELERVQRNIGARCCKPTQLRREVQELTRVPGAQTIFRFQSVSVQSLSGEFGPGERFEQLIFLVPMRTRVSVRPSKPSATRKR